MEKLIRFLPAFDKRDPDPAKNYGIRPAQIWFVLKGAHGAVHFSLSTGWNLPHVQKEQIERGAFEPLAFPSGISVGVHTPGPQHEGQEIHTQECPYLDGKPCYCSLGFLESDRVAGLLIREGDEAVWKWLESRYLEVIGEVK